MFTFIIIEVCGVHFKFEVLRLMPQPHPLEPRNTAFIGLCPAPSRLKSRKSFLHEVQPLSQPPQTARLTLWEEQRSAKQHLAKLPIPTSEQLAPGHKSEWKLWKSLNRLRTGMGRSKTNMSKWGYADTADTACECGTSEQTMQHLLRCPLLENECSLEDLATANEKALHCARAWPNIWLNSEMMDTKEEEGLCLAGLTRIRGANVTWCDTRFKVHSTCSRFWWTQWVAHSCASDPPPLPPPRTLLLFLYIFFYIHKSGKTYFKLESLKAVK